MDIGKTISDLRSGKNMSQQTLADLLFVSRDLVSKWENGTRTPDYPTVERIAVIFGVSPDTIIDKNDVIFEELSECVADIGGVSREELTKLVNVFLKDVKERSADVFLERYYHLKTTAEIAAEYRIGENHVRSMLSKLRKRLKKHIKESLQ